MSAWRVGGIESFLASLCVKDGFEVNSLLDRYVRLSRKPNASSAAVTKAKQRLRPKVFEAISEMQARHPRYLFDDLQFGYGPQIRIGNLEAAARERRLRDQIDDEISVAYIDSRPDILFPHLRDEDIWDALNEL